MKFVLLLIMTFMILFADSTDIFDYRNHKGHTDFTQPYSGDGYNKTKYVLERLKNENRLYLIKDEMERLKQQYAKEHNEGLYKPSDWILLDRAADAILKDLPDCIDDMVKKKVRAEKDKKEIQAEALRLNRHFKAHKVSNIVQVTVNICDKDKNNTDGIYSYCYSIDFNLDKKITKAQKTALIQMQQELASCKGKYEIYGRFWESFLESVTDYLVDYSIKHKDEVLMKEILFKGVLSGNACNASFGEYINETQYIPFYMRYPNIDSYLNQKEIERAADIISEVIDRYNQVTGDDKGIWEKYNSTFVFPDKYAEKKYKYIDFIKTLHRQSPRLAREVDYWHMRTVLGVNGLMGTEDENDFWR